MATSSSTTNLQVPLTSQQSDATSIHSSQAEVWYLKHILFGTGDSRRSVKIITQNFNGPCSFVAICNILILRGNIEILPHDRMTVSYEFLSQLVGEYLLMNCPDIDISAALSIMPTTTKGLDLNPQFTAVTSFDPTGDGGGGELKLFNQAGIKLVHGWLVDPHSPESNVISQLRDYDSAVTLIADADHITKGKLLTSRSSDAGAGSSDVGSSSQPGGGGGGGGGSSNRVWSSDVGVSSQGSYGDNLKYSEEDRQKIEHAIVAKQFLDSTQSQLTYHGLFQLASTLTPGSLVALFRNSHLSVLYKSSSSSSSDDDDVPALYSLVTDDVFQNEPSVVWERLEDVDGGWSTFVDSDFKPSTPIGGDFAGQTAEGALRRFEIETGQDQALAQQLQAEEDENAQQAYLRRQQLLQGRRLEEDKKAKDKDKDKKDKKKKDKDKDGEDGDGKSKKRKNCVIM